MEFENEYLWGRAMARPYGCGIMDGIYDNWYFFGGDDVHIVPTFDGYFDLIWDFIAMEF
ncbi:MAG: hypothetical protein J5725_02465 [Bacteroidales bacterium]|nr:hypothetical protein [Bacteroidales bacterium]